ncbi:MAG: hypothetical protein V4632_23910, partial [Pseudomonadota bacterium]
EHGSKKTYRCVRIYLTTTFPLAGAPPRGAHRLASLCRYAGVRQCLTKPLLHLSQEQRNFRNFRKNIPPIKILAVLTGMGNNLNKIHSHLKAGINVQAYLNGPFQ